jgi:transposase
MYRFDLSEPQWQQIEPFFPDRYHHGRAGHPWNEHRPLVNGLLWHLHSGAPWPDTPERYGPWHTVYDRFNFTQKRFLTPRSSNHFMAHTKVAVKARGFRGVPEPLYSLTCPLLVKSKR